MDVIETIYKRRSIRNYLDRQVERDTIMTLLKAATSVPTAANYQPREFIVIDEAKKLGEIKDKLIFARYNVPAAIDNVLNAATSLELGTVWIGIYPKESNIK